MTITPEQVAKLAADGEPWCVKCGKRRSEHHYRHPFQPSHTTTLEAAAHNMADLIARMDEALKAADEMSKTIYEAKSLGYFNTVRHRIFAAELEYRAAREKLK